METAPNDHRLYSNRALCYLAVEDWARARDDAQYCARLRPDFKKAWLLLTKALWKMNRLEEASDQLQQGLLYLPGCSELLELQADFSREVAEKSFRTVSRSVSPVYTPTPSRNQTPTRGGNYMGPSPGKRPVSPPLVAAGGLAAQNRSPPSPGPAQTYAGPGRSPGTSSRSPGPSGQRDSNRPNLDASGTFHTGNFGAPTPVFAAGNKMNPSGPSHDPMTASFPASAQTMWAGANPGSATQRSNYSPGPATSGPGTARSGHSPGPSFGPGPDLNRSMDPSSPGLQSTRKTGSLKSMLESSSRSRGNTPPSRKPTPPPPPPKGSFTPPRGGVAA